jgi:hypothetical protein
VSCRRKTIRFIWTYTTELLGTCAENRRAYLRKRLIFTARRVHCIHFRVGFITTGVFLLRHEHAILRIKHLHITSEGNHRRRLVDRAELAGALWRRNLAERLPSCHCISTNAR